jgi:hypothetical protein
MSVIRTVCRRCGLVDVLGSTRERTGRVSPEPPPQASAPVFCRDDVLDLHLLLDRHDWWEQLLRLTGRPER